MMLATALPSDELAAVPPSSRVRAHELLDALRSLSSFSGTTCRCEVIDEKLTSQSADDMWERLRNGLFQDDSQQVEVSSLQSLHVAVRVAHYESYIGRLMRFANAVGQLQLRFPRLEEVCLTLDFGEAFDGSHVFIRQWLESLPALQSLHVDADPSTSHQVLQDLALQQPLQRFQCSAVKDLDDVAELNLPLADACCVVIPRPMTYSLLHSQLAKTHMCVQLLHPLLLTSDEDYLLWTTRRLEGRDKERIVFSAGMALHLPLDATLALCPAEKAAFEEELRIDSKYVELHNIDLLANPLQLKWVQEQLKLPAFADAKDQPYAELHLYLARKQPASLLASVLVGNPDLEVGTYVVCVHCEGCCNDGRAKENYLHALCSAFQQTVPQVKFAAEV